MFLQVIPEIKTIMIKTRVAVFHSLTIEYNSLHHRMPIKKLNNKVVDYNNYMAGKEVSTKSIPVF